MKTLISRISSSGSLSDAFCESSFEEQAISSKVSTEKSKKFNALFDALNYSNLTKKAEQLEFSTVCNICREKCFTKKYYDSKNKDVKHTLNLCEICCALSYIKSNWIELN